MRSRRRRATSEPNIYVALSDLAIALAFIFAICSIALSKSLDDIQRNLKQEKSYKIAAAIPASMGYKFEEVEDPIAKDKKLNRSVDIFIQNKSGSERRRFLKVQTNASYQRITLSDCFEFGKSELSYEGTKRFSALAEALVKYFVQYQDSYLYFHGIAESKETVDAPGARDSLANQRAANVYNLFVQKGLVKIKSDKLSRGVFPEEFAIGYGKSALYTSSGKENLNRIPGRVDIIIFMTDGIPPQQSASQ
jgi:hypothetical protein